MLVQVELARRILRHEAIGRGGSASRALINQGACRSNHGPPRHAKIRLFPFLIRYR